MRALGSLSNRLFLVMVLLSIASIGGAMLFVSARLTREHDRALALRLDETITLVERHRRLLLDTSTRLARLVADLPKLKAALATDLPTVAPIVSSYRDEIGADVLIVSDAAGAPVFTAGDARGDVTTRRLAADRRGPGISRHVLHDGAPPRDPAGGERADRDRVRAGRATRAPERRHAAGRRAGPATPGGDGQRTGVRDGHRRARLVDRSRCGSVPGAGHRARGFRHAADR